MTETIHRFSRPLVDAEGRAYVAEAHGREGESGLWVGWIVFSGVGRSVVLQTGIESHQPDRRALAYWASGLQPSYLEGALTRAMRARVEEFIADR